VRGIAGLLSTASDIAPGLAEAFATAVGAGATLLRPARHVVLGAGTGADSHVADGRSAVSAGEVVAPPGGPAVATAAQVVIAAASGDKSPAEALCGSFAYAMWDDRRQELELAVDRFRFSPLVYARFGDVLAFASDLRLLRALPGFDGEIDPIAMVEYLNLAVIPAPRTFFRGARKLRAAHRLRFRRGAEPVIEPYWRLHYRDDAGVPAATLAVQLREGLAESVRRHAAATDGTRVGAFLSGGLDSSTVIAYLAALGPCDAFSIGFEDERYNEIDYARLVAHHFGARHHEYFVTPEDLADSLETVVCHFDEPFGNSSVIPTYFCARMAREAGIDLLLAGDGGDELFAGNERYATDHLFQMYGRVPAFLRRGLLEPLLSNDLSCTLPGIGKVGRYIRRARQPNPDRILSYGLFVDGHRAEVFQSDFLAAIRDYRAVDAARAIYAEGDAAGELGRLLLFDHQLTLADNDLRKVGEATELAGVRVRYPMLDRQIAELAGRVPAHTLMRGTRLRAFYKEALVEVLPKAVIDKQKHGFGLPFANWLRTDPSLRDRVAASLESDNSPLAPYVRPAFLRHLHRAHLDETEPYYAELLWPFLALSIWLAGE
jgi:asparagine synthase (glutamine-hydrolysing)